MRVDLTNIDYVKGLQQNLRVCFENESGKEIMRFLEKACGWYETIYTPADRDLILLNAGKREVVATIKSLIKLTPQEIISVARKGE